METLYYLLAHSLQCARNRANIPQNANRSFNFQLRSRERKCQMAGCIYKVSPIMDIPNMQPSAEMYLNKILIITLEGLNKFTYLFV